MKNIILILLLTMSIILIFLSQNTFYSSPIKTVYRYDGDYKIGGDRYDKNDKKIEGFTYHSYINDKKLVVIEEVNIIHYTFWGKARNIVFVFSIISTVIVIIILILSNKDKIKVEYESNPKEDKGVNKIRIVKKEDIKENDRSYNIIIQFLMSAFIGCASYAFLSFTQIIDGFNDAEMIKNMILIAFFLLSFVFLNLKQTNKL